MVLLLRRTPILSLDHQMHFCIEGTFTAQKHVGVGYQSTMRTSGMFSLALRLLALRRLRFLVRE